MAKQSVYVCEGCRQGFPTSDAKYNHKRKTPACKAKKGTPGVVSTPAQQQANKTAREQRRQAKAQRAREDRNRAQRAAEARLQSLRSAAAANLDEEEEKEEVTPEETVSEESLHPPFQEGDKPKTPEKFHPLLSGQASKLWAEHYLQKAGECPSVGGFGVSSRVAVQRHKELEDMGILDSLSPEQNKAAFAGHAREPGYSRRQEGRSHPNDWMGLGFRGPLTKR